MTNGDLGPAGMPPKENNGGQPSNVPPKPVQNIRRGAPGGDPPPVKTPAAASGGAKPSKAAPKLVVHFQPDAPKASQAANGGKSSEPPPKLVLQIQPSAPKGGQGKAAKTGADSAPVVYRRAQPARPAAAQPARPAPRPAPAEPTADNGEAPAQAAPKRARAARPAAGEKKRKRAAPAAPRRKLRPLERVALCVPVLAAVAAVIAVMAYTHRLMSYELTGSPCQYYGGSVYPISAGTTLRRTSDGVTVLEDSSGTHDANDLPLYYEDRDVLTTTQDMVYYAPRSGAYGRLEYFSDLSLLRSGRVAVTHGGEEFSLEPGFLYNGEDLYIFTETVTLDFNGYKLELPPFSYVEAVYTGDVMVFNYETKECLMEPPQGAVTASAAASGYEVSLINDSMTSNEGKRTLLFSRPELLDPVG